MARIVKTCVEGGHKYEFGEYSSGTFAKTYAIPTSLRTCVYATGYLEGADLWAGGTACVTSLSQPITSFSVCAASGQNYLDFSLACASDGITPDCLVYFAVGT